MFYSQFILAKKGPLGTIWIAAHLERKLRKNQVADTDIGLSVDSILSPEVPIALRLSSHLLLGVVRIYSRKVNYLFHDCSEALLKVKQAFRSTAVDLPPEESTAPYHSITLPETFHLDDFELPDSAFQGDFIDHHVSTKEQITLQDTMDGTGFSSMQFGLDERFGDGNASHIGLDLDEDIFLDKHLSGQHFSLTSGPDECSGHQQQCSSSVFAAKMEVEKQNEFFKAMNSELSNERPMLFDDYDRQSVGRKKKDDLSSQCPGYNVQTPDLNEVFSIVDHVEGPPPDLIECAHAPSTPGLVEEIFPASAHESPALSPQQKLSPVAGEATVKLDEQPDLVTDNDLMHPIPMDPLSVGTMQVVPSHTSISLEQAEHATVPDETQMEYLQKDVANIQNNFASVEAKELTVDDQGHGPGEVTLGEENQLEDIRVSSSCDASISIVSFDGLPVDNGAVLAAPKISSDNFLAFDALVHNDTLLAEDAQPSPSSSSFPLKSCTSQANLSKELATEDGALVQKASEVSTEEQGAQSLGSAKELFQDDDLASGKNCPTGNVTDASLEVHEKFGDSVTGPNIHVSNGNELLTGHLENDTELEQLNGSSTSEFPEPEKMLLAPPGEQDQANDLSRIVSEKGITESDGSVNRVDSLSGRKRPLEESASFMQNVSSAKLSGRSRLKINSEHIPDDDDLLASILVGKRTPLLRVGSTPPPPREASLKRPRMQSRLGISKRKVLLDDTTVLHADAIRQQLINTEDIRRIRKKAPCTRPEIWVIQRSALEDEIFDEPVLTGISEKLTYLQTIVYNSEVKSSKEDDLSRSLELVSIENEKARAVSDIEANKGGATEEVCGPSGSNELRSDKNTDEFIHHVNLQPSTNLHKLDSSDNTASLKNSTEDSSEKEKDVLSSISDLPSSLEVSGAHPMTDESSLPNPTISTSLLGKSNELHMHNLQPSVDAMAQTRDGPFAVNQALSNLSKDARAEDLTSPLYPDSVMANHEVEGVADDVTMFHAEGTCDPTDSSVMAECKSSNGVLDSNTHEVEAANVISSSVVISHTSLPFQSMVQNDELADAAIATDHPVMGDGESILGAEVNDGSIKPLIIGKNTVPYAICEEPEHTSIRSSQANGENGNAPSVVGETSGVQLFHLEGDIAVESMPMDLATAKESSDFCSAVDGNDTEFLNVDDDDDYEAAGEDVPNTQDAQSLENSGWSSRTRGVAKYLKTLFDEETGLGRKAVVMDQLIAAKTRKEASRMFFETLVLKTKDYIHVEQENPYDLITIKPSAKLLKSGF